MRKFKYAMDNARTIYETLLKKRCSDSHWSKVKRLAADRGIPLDRDGLSLIIELKKLNSRYFSLYPSLQSEMGRIGMSFSSPIGEGLRGEELVNLILSELDINPPKSTIYRWFYKLGVRYKNTQLYDRKTCTLILTSALIYKARKQKTLPQKDYTDD